MDLDGLAWGAQNLRASDWTQAQRARGLEPETRALARNLAALRALGYLDDIVEDEALPVGKKDLTAWWRHRQAKLVRELGRIG
jgi:hypothetical protein